MTRRPSRAALTPAAHHPQVVQPAEDRHLWHLDPASGSCMCECPLCSDDKGCICPDCRDDSEGHNHRSVSPAAWTCPHCATSITATSTPASSAQQLVAMVAEWHEPRCDVAGQRSPWATLPDAPRRSS